MTFVGPYTPVAASVMQVSNMPGCGNLRSEWQYECRESSFEFEWLRCCKDWLDTFPCPLRWRNTFLERWSSLACWKGWMHALQESRATLLIGMLSKMQLSLLLAPCKASRQYERLTLLCKSLRTARSCPLPRWNTKGNLRESTTAAISHRSSTYALRCLDTLCATGSLTPVHLADLRRCTEI